MSRAAQQHVAGRMWPPGRRLPMPDLKAEERVEEAPEEARSQREGYEDPRDTGTTDT